MVPAHFCLPSRCIWMASWAWQSHWGGLLGGPWGSCMDNGDPLSQLCHLRLFRSFPTWCLATKMRITDKQWRKWSLNFRSNNCWSPDIKFVLELLIALNFQRLTMKSLTNWKTDTSAVWSLRQLHLEWAYAGRVHILFVYHLAFRFVILIQSLIRSLTLSYGWMHKVSCVVASGLF